MSLTRKFLPELGHRSDHQEVKLGTIRLGVYRQHRTELGRADYFTVNTVFKCNYILRGRKRRHAYAKELNNLLRGHVWMGFEGALELEIDWE